MPERRFDTAYWNEPYIMKLPFKAKLLYIYLWTNIHCNQAGCYEIAIETISWETGLIIEEIPDLLEILKKKVSWLPEQNLIWVKNFLHRQTKSPTFLAAAAKCLENINNNGLVDEFIAYNKRYTLSIPYQYPMDRVSIPPYTYSYTKSLSKSLSDEGGSLFGSFSLLRDRLREAASGSVDRLVEHEHIKQELAKMGQEQGLDVQSEWEVKGGRIDLCWFDSSNNLVAAFEVDVHQPKEKSLAKLSNLDCPVRCIILRTGDPYYLEQGIHVIGLGIDKMGNGKGEDLSSEEQEIIAVWRSVGGFAMTLRAMVELLSRIRTDCPDIHILTESRKWAARKISEPLTPQSRPSSQIYNFMANRHKWNQEQKESEKQSESKFSGVRCTCGYCGPDVGRKNCPICHEPFAKDEK